MFTSSCFTNPNSDGLERMWFAPALKSASEYAKAFLKELSQGKKLGLLLSFA
jgi:hypothetical protein